MITEGVTEMPMDGVFVAIGYTPNTEIFKGSIKSGMPISMAYAKKPDAVYLPVDFDYYEDISRKIMPIIKANADKFEQVSVDEAFIDISKKVADHHAAVSYAQKLHDEILDKIGIRCSIGIGPNKLIAKMACEKAKPNGIKLVKEEDVSAFLKDLDVNDLYGIGGKTSERLKNLGYRTAGELANANVMQMMNHFGTFGPVMIQYAKGIDESQVTENYEVKSIGRELTFENDTADTREINSAIERLSKDVMAEVSKSQVSFKTVTVKLRYSGFIEHIHSRSVRITSDYDMLIETAKQLCTQSIDTSRKVRKIGVRVSNLVKCKGQKKIF